MLKQLSSDGKHADPSINTYVCTHTLRRTHTHTRVQCILFIPGTDLSSLHNKLIFSEHLRDLAYESLGTFLVSTRQYSVFPREDTPVSSQWCCKNAHSQGVVCPGASTPNPKLPREPDSKLEASGLCVGRGPSARRHFVVVVEGQVEMLDLHWLGRKVVSVGGWTRWKHAGLREGAERHRCWTSGGIRGRCQNAGSLKVTSTSH